MADRVLLSARQGNFDDVVALAREHRLGIELTMFAVPDVLDGDWRSLARQYRPALQSLDAPVAMHGPFMDMAAGSPDRLINEVVAERYRHSIRVAAEVGASLVVLHANFIAAIHTIDYRRNWHERNVQFWGPIAEYGFYQGVRVAVENMWEFDPHIITDVLHEVDHPYLRACLDVGHAHLYGEVPFDEWLRVLEPYIIHCHLNNNDGKVDIHMDLGHGVLEYPNLLRQLRRLPRTPSLTLEMEEVDLMRASLPFLELETPASRAD